MAARRPHRGDRDGARRPGSSWSAAPRATIPVAASTAGTGELIVAALDAGARRVIVGLGGSATTDGGLAALRALHPLGRLKGIELVVACDSRVPFLDAATVFAPQKGATPRRSSCCDAASSGSRRCTSTSTASTCSPSRAPAPPAGSGGGLAAAGGELVSGFDLVADEVGLDERLEGADLVITGEGFLDEQSFEGKVVGGVAALAERLGVPVVAIAGQVYDDGAGPHRGGEPGRAVR